MANLIDKDALVAEIERRIADNKREIERASHKNLEDYFEGYEDALVLFKEKFLDTLKVKEVDFEKIWKEYFKYRGDVATVNVKHLAKHFYELGLKAQKGK